MKITDLNEGKGYIDYSADNFDPSNPTIAISGYGTITMSGFKKMIARDLENMKSEMEQGNMNFVMDLLSPSSSFIHKLQAYQDANDELSNPQTKRKLSNLSKTQ
jgi:hypothetical protein